MKINKNRPGPIVGLPYIINSTDAYWFILAKWFRITLVQLDISLKISVFDNQVWQDNDLQKTN